MRFNQRTDSLVVIINDRYFYKYSKNRCLTAWSLAGARLFQPMDFDRCVAIVKAETAKGKMCRVKVVS